jgi:hypothetical protein
VRINHIVVGFPLLFAGAASAATLHSFDGIATDTPVTLQQFGDPPGASIQPTGGNPATGGYLQLTPNINSQNNWATFDRSDPIAAPASTFAFDFRFDNLGAGGADGISFNYYNTTTYGASGNVSGSPLFTPEDPTAAGVLGIGFDTWGNVAPLDYQPAPPAELQANYSEISLFYNGTLVQRVDDTRTLPAGAFNMKDGAWHRATGTVNFNAATVTLLVDGAAIFTNATVDGLTPFESRVGFAGRTGGANEQTSIDNLNVQFVPEPTGAALLGIGALLLARRRRN